MLYTKHDSHLLDLRLLSFLSYEFLCFTFSDINTKDSSVLISYFLFIVKFSLLYTGYWLESGLSSLLSLLTC